MTGYNFDRRHFLAGASLVLGGSQLLAQAPQPPDISHLIPAIDVHAHMTPQFLVEGIEATGFRSMNGSMGWPAWSPEAAVGLMDRARIATGMLSVPFPGVAFADPSARVELVRKVNDYGAKLVSEKPTRFGLFASLPLPDVDGSIRELSRCSDELRADGVVIESNAGGLYPGDPAMDPLLAEMNRRGTVVFVHPTAPFCPGCRAVPTGMAAPVLEFMFETTRLVANLIATRALDRFPKIRFIIPHAGAALPVLADRLAVAGPPLTDDARFTSDDVYAALKKLHFDLAGMPFPRQLAALRTLVSDSQLLYGSDWPYTPEPGPQYSAGMFMQTFGADLETMAAIRRDNALRLFPRLAD